MNIAVSDEAVAQYADRIRKGVPLGKLFPAKMADCEFTEKQRLVIRQARLYRKSILKDKRNGSGVSGPEQAATEGPAPGSAAAQTVGQAKPRAFKLRRLLYLQSGKCFFCGEPLSEADASIEHLNPLSRGGAKSEDNEVVCHASLNQIFGSLELKRKFELILKSSGKFVCPGR